MTKRLFSFFLILILTLASLGGALAEPPAGACSGADAVRNNYQHFWTTVSQQAATCTTPAAVVYQCVYCGQMYTEYMGSPTGHVMVQINRVDATCIAPGSVTYQCEICGEKNTEILPPSGAHEYGEWVVDEKATCKERELQRRTCKICKNIEWRYFGNLQPHSFGDWVTVVPATAYANGTEERTCSVCGAKEQREIAAAQPQPQPQPQSQAQASLKLDAAVSGGPYVLGNVISIDYTLTNTGSVPLTLVQAEGVEGIALPETLAAGSMFMWEGQHVVSQRDIDNAYPAPDGGRLLMLPAIVQYAYTLGGQTFTVDGENFLSVPLGSGTDMHLRMGSPTGDDDSPMMVVEAELPKNLPMNLNVGDTIGVTVKRINTGASSLSEREMKLESDTQYSDDVNRLDNFKEWRDYIYDIPGNTTVPYQHIITVQPEDVSKGYIDRTIAIRYVFDPTGVDYDPLSGRSEEEWSEPVTITIPLTGGSTEGNPPISVPDPEPQPQPDPEPQPEPEKTIQGSDASKKASLVTVEKTVVSEPANASGYAPGEKIKFEIKVTNHTGSTLNYVEINDVLAGDEVLDTPTILDGETVSFVYIYTVTDEDAENKNVANTASATWRDPESGEMISSMSNVVNVTIIERQPLSFTLEKTIVSKPKSEKGFALGDEIVFRITATNRSHEAVEHISIQDFLAAPILGSSTLKEIEHLAPGASDVVEWTYTVTEKDAKENGYVTNVAYILYDDPAEHTVKALYSNVVTAKAYAPEPDMITPEPELIPPVTLPPVTPEPELIPPVTAAPDITPVPELIPPVTPIPLPEDTEGMTVTKTVESFPKNGSFYQVNETVSYVIHVINNGTLPLTDIKVYDILKDEGKTEIASIKELAPGATSEDIRFTHVVNSDDIDNGQVLNRANALAYGQMGTILTAETEDVTVPTGREIYPPVTNQPAPTQAPSCRVILTGHGDGAWAYTLRLCDEHRGTAARSGMGSEASMQAMSGEGWIEAARIWREAVQEEYARLGETEDMAAFFSLIDSEKALLERLYDDPFMAAREAAYQMMFRCVELCDIRTHPNLERLECLEAGYADPLQPPVVTGVTFDADGQIVFTFADAFAAADSAGEGTDIGTWQAIRTAYVDELYMLLGGVDQENGGALTQDIEALWQKAIGMLDAHQIFLNRQFPDRAAENEQIITQMAMRMLVRAMHFTE